MSMATPTTGRFLVDIGWTSSGGETLFPNTTNTGSPWNRTGTIIISQNGGSGAVLTITAPGGAAPITAAGQIPGMTCCPFEAASNANLDAVTGELVVGFDDFVFPVALNDTVNLRADSTGSSLPVVSTITGSMIAEGGTGGGGGDSSTGVAGGDGLDSGMGDGADGGAGGAGASAGGNGGQGGDGAAVDAHEDGIFQGVIEIWVDN
jgi:hypothetical protein